MAGESKISHFTRGELRALGRVLFPVVQVYGHPRSCRAAADRSIQLLREAVKAKPKEWVYWYALGDFHQSLAQVAESVRVCQTCYGLRPEDPRSVYSLATAYRLLTRAKYVDDPGHVDTMRAIQDALGGEGEAVLDPRWAQAALENLGLTLEQAAQYAYGLFGSLLQMGITFEDRRVVMRHLTGMEREFPFLG